MEHNKEIPIKEASEYLAEFSYMLRSKIVATVGGLCIIAMGLLFFNLFFSIIAFSGGSVIFYYGFKELINPKAKLKLAKTGLWTEKLGFKPWSSIKNIRIEIDEYPVNSGNYNSLKIYLMENDTIHPDQELMLDALKNSERIKPLIDEICGKDLKCEEIKW